MAHVETKAQREARLKRERQQQLAGLAILVAIVSGLFMGCRSENKLVRWLSYGVIIAVVLAVVGAIFGNGGK